MTKKDEKATKQPSPAKVPEKAEKGKDAVTAKGSLDEAYSAQPEFSE